MDVFNVLKGCALLKDFTDDGVKIIQSIAKLKYLDPGSPIFVERMQGDSLYIIAEGEVILYVSRQTGWNDVASLRAFEHFGEFALLSPGPRRINARADGAVTLVEIDRRDFAALQKQRPQACLKLMMNIVDRVGIRLEAAAPMLQRLLDYA